MILDQTTKSLEVILGGAVATAQPVFYAAYADHTLTTFVPGASDGLTNGATAVTAVAAPTSGIQRQIKLFSLFNNDTAAVTATVRINNNAVLRIVVKITLAVGDTLEYDPSNGWKVITAAGMVKSGISPAGATGEVQYNAGGGSLGASPNFAWSIANNQLLFGNGTAANPSWAFVNSPGTGIFRQAADAIGISTGGVGRWLIDNAGMFLPAGTDNALDVGSAANRIRDLFVGTSVKIGSPAFAVGPGDLATTGVLRFGSGASERVTLRSSSAGQFDVQGSLVPLTDNFHDLATASFRWRDAFLSSSVRIGTTPAAAGALRLANAGEIRGRNLANTADVILALVNSADEVSLAAGGADIRWGKALVALGGGAAPTFGTIGGAGPATAAQNTWMRVVDSTGVAFWVPAWK